MKKKLLSSLLILSMAAVLIAGCGKNGEDAAADTPVEVTVEPIPEQEEVVEETPVEEETPEVDVVSDEVPEGMYRSELTNLPISEEIKNQRPVAVMVDNESLALPHFGTAEADIIYENMNSTLNGRITRFMVLVKELQGLALNVKMYTPDGKEIKLQEAEEAYIKNPTAFRSRYNTSNAKNNKEDILDAERAAKVLAKSVEDDLEEVSDLDIVDDDEI